MPDIPFSSGGYTWPRFLFHPYKFTYSPLPVVKPKHIPRTPSVSTPRIPMCSNVSVRLLLDVAQLLTSTF